MGGGSDCSHCSLTPELQLCNFVGGALTGGKKLSKYKLRRKNMCPDLDNMQNVSTRKDTIGGSRVPPATPPPQGSRFFRFDVQISRDRAVSGVGAPPYEVGAPHGKSWIRHWIRTSTKKKCTKILKHRVTIPCKWSFVKTGNFHTKTDGSHGFHEILSLVPDNSWS